VVVEEGVDLDEGGREVGRERAGSTWVGRREKEISILKEETHEKLQQLQG